MITEKDIRKAYSFLNFCVDSKADVEKIKMASNTYNYLCEKYMEQNQKEVN